MGAWLSRSARAHRARATRPINIIVHVEGSGIAELLPIPELVKIVSSPGPTKLGSIAIYGSTKAAEDDDSGNAGIGGALAALAANM
jgi:hypothetical protein